MASPSFGWKDVKRELSRKMDFDQAMGKAKTHEAYMGMKVLL